MSETFMIDQLDDGIEALLACESVSPGSEPAVVQLLAVADKLRTLPCHEFRARLQAELNEAATNPNAPARHTTRIGVARPLSGRRPDLNVAGQLFPMFSSSVYGAYPVQRRSFMASLAVHAAVMALVVTASIWAAPSLDTRPQVTTLIVTDISPYPLHAAADETHGGGGGGTHDRLAATKGAPPRLTHEQVTPPTIIVAKEPPNLPLEATVAGPPDLPLPQGKLGDLGGVLDPPSNGIGSKGGIGSGEQGGVGPGSGPGVGDGRYGGYGGGPYLVGRGVSAPRAIYDPEPEYSEEARKSRFQGVVVLRIVVGADGQTRDVRIARSLGFGLDEKAIEAVRQWRFEPGMLNGRPVPVMVNIEVSFRLY